MIEVEFAKLEDAPEALRPLAEARDSKFYVKLDTGSGVGVVSAATAATELAGANKARNEFRDNNNELKNKNTDLLAKVAEAERLKEEHAELKKAEEERKLKDVKDRGNLRQEDFQSSVARAVEAAQGPMQKVMDKLQSDMKLAQDEKVAAEVRLARKELEAALSTAGLKAGVDEKALQDFLHRGMKVWSIKDGAFMAAKEDGTPLYDDKGQPVSMDEYAASMTTEAPHLFKSSGGGGAQPNKTGGGGGNNDRGPRKVLVNPTAREIGDNLDELAKAKMTISVS